MKQAVQERWVGLKFGRLTVTDAWVDGQVTRAKCVCECGASIVTRVADVKSGNTSSCGCFRREATSRRLTTHGATETPLYSVWTDIKKRCYSPKHRYFSHYGARGISMSAEWKDSFQQFREDVGERPSPAHEIDRIDNDGNYCKGNCRWVTHKENMRNTRRALIVSIDGKRVHLKDLAEQSGIPYLTLYYRLKQGQPLIR